MTLSQIERLVLTVNSVLDGKRGGGIEIARELAEAYRGFNSRLNQVSALLANGESVQALQISEEQPPLPELIRVLGFPRLAAWRSMCQKSGWVVCEDPDEKKLLKLDEAYAQTAKGRAGSGALMEDYRGRMLRGDRNGAIALLRVQLRKSPEDTWAQKELGTLLEGESRAMLQRLQRVVVQGDGGMAAEILDAFDRAGLAGSGESIYRQADQLRIGFRKKQIEEYARDSFTQMKSWKDADQWGELVQLADTVREGVRTYGSVLPTDSEYQKLLLWAEQRRTQEQKKEQGKHLELELRVLLARLEEERGRQISKNSNMIREDLAHLDRFRRAAEELTHRWAEDLDGRRRREEMLLQEEDKSHGRRTFLAGSLIGVIVLGAIGTGGWLVYQRNVSDREVHSMEELISKREVSAAERYLKDRELSLASEPSPIQSQAERLKSFIVREKKSAKKTVDAIGAFSRGLEDPNRKWSEEQIGISSLTSQVEALAQDLRGEVQTEKERVENRWRKYAAEEKGKRETEQAIVLKSQSAEMATMDPIKETSLQRLTLLLDELHQKMKQWDEEIPPLRPGEAMRLQTKKILQEAQKKMDIAVLLMENRRQLAEAVKKNDVDAYRIVLGKLSENLQLPADFAEKAQIAFKAEMRKGQMNARLWMSYAQEEWPNVVEKGVRFLPVTEGLPKEKVAAKKLSIGLLDDLQAYVVPDPNNPSVQITVFNIGKFKKYERDSVTMIPYAPECYIYDPEENSGPAAFSFRKKLQLGGRREVPQNIREGVSELAQSSGLFGMASKLAEENSVPHEAGPVVQKIFDKIFSATNVNVLGRAYLAQNLSELCQIGSRPYEFGLCFSPTLTGTMTQFRNLDVVDEGRWLWSSIRNPPSETKKYDELFAQKKPSSFCKEALFLSSVARQGVRNQLDFVGFVSESGNFPDLGEGYFLVAEGEGIRIFQGQRHGLRPFCPIFRLSLDPNRILEQAKVESGVSEEESKGFLNSYLPHFLR